MEDFSNAVNEAMRNVVSRLDKLESLIQFSSGSFTNQICALYRVLDQTIHGDAALYKVQFDAAYYDPSSMFNAGNNSITIPEDGEYEVAYQIFWTQVSGPDVNFQLSGQISKNGVGFGGLSGVYPQDENFTGINMQSAPVPAFALNAGDEMTVEVSYASNHIPVQDILAAAAFTMFWVKRVG